MFLSEHFKIIYVCYFKALLGSLEGFGGEERKRKGRKFLTCLGSYIAVKGRNNIYE
jgi:hypothetical protein